MLARLLLETSDDKDKATSNGNPPEIAAKRGHTNLTDDGWLIREQQHRVRRASGSTQLSIRGAQPIP
eukprot:s1841_g10.t1